MRFWCCSLILAMIGTVSVNAAPAPSESIYIVSYVDVLAAASRRAAKALEQYRDQSRREPGALGIDVFAQMHRPSGFAVVEVWQDKAAFDAHRKAAATEQLDRDMQALHLGPWDVHVHSDYYQGSAAIGLPRALTLLVHVDVIPPLAAEYAGILKDYIDGIRGEPGLLRFAVLQSLAPRTNHFTVVEDWRDDAALEAHQKAAFVQTYRGVLAHELASPYDERAYQKLN